MPEIPAAPLNLTDRTVLVTGGNGGIGLGMASACGAAGAQIVIWGRDEAKNEGAVAGLREAGIPAHGFGCEVTEPDQGATVWERHGDWKRVDDGKSGPDRVDPGS